MSFGFAEEAVIDKDAGKLGTDCLLEEDGEDGGIDSTGQTAKDLIITDERTDSFTLAFEEFSHSPCAGALAYFIEEIAKDVDPVRRVGNFGMKLDADERDGSVLNGGAEACSGNGEDTK